MQRIATALISAVLLLGAAPGHADTLLDIYRLALQSDPQLRAAEAGWKAAQEARPQSRAGLLPQLNAGAELVNTRRDISGGSEDRFNSHGYSLELSQSLYNHRNYVGLRQADAVIAQADAAYQAARQVVILRVAEAYFNLLSAKDDLNTAEATKLAISQQLRQTQQRFEVGLSAITDVHEAQAGYDAAVAAEIAAQNGLDVANEALREIIGREPGSLASLGESMPLISPQPANIEEWVNTALQQNLALLAADAGTRIAAEGIKLRQAGHYPNLGLFASHAFSDTTDDPMQGSEVNRTQIGVRLSVPLYSGGLTTSQTREARALYEQATEGLEQQRRATVRDTRSAFLGVMAGISQVQARRQALSSAQTALEATEAGFEVGTRTMVDVLGAQSQRFLAQRDYSRARYDYALASLRLKQAAGMLEEQDIVEVSSWMSR
ncbi:MAG: TolC family outer membrane protein [Thiohalomonadaceae bacterium]